MKMKMSVINVVLLLCISYHMVWTAPVSQEEEANGSTLQAAMQLVGRSGLRLASDINVMLELSANTEMGLRTTEMRTMCGGFIDQCQNLVGQMEALQQVAAREGKEFVLQSNQHIIRQTMRRMLSQMQLSPYTIIMILFHTSSVGMDNARQSVLMSALGQLSHMTANEARFAFFNRQETSADDLQEWLDKLLVIARTVTMVTEGVIDNIDDAERLLMDSPLLSIQGNTDQNKGYHILNQEPMERARRDTRPRLEISDLGSLFGSASDRREFLDDLSSTLRGMIPTLEMGGFNMDQEGMRYRGRHITLDISFDPQDRS